MTESFEDFAERELVQLLRYAMLLTGDRELARDLVQDVMLKAHSRWQQVSMANHPRAYVRKMITNAHLSWRRRWSVRNVLLGQNTEMLDLEPAPDHFLLVDERARLWQLLSMLPRQQRAAVVLRFYEGLTDQEIADVLSCSVGTVRGYISRALATLRRQLDPYAVHTQEQR